MNENEYQALCEQINAQGCVFEKALLTQRCHCSQALHIRISERAVVSCKLLQAQQDCQHLLDILQQNARFALKITQPHAPLSHASRLKIQCGGLYGLQQLLVEKTATPLDPHHAELPFRALLVKNIYALVQQAQQSYPQFQQLPLTNILRQIALFEARPSRKP